MDVLDIVAKPGGVVNLFAPLDTDHLVVGEGRREVAAVGRHLPVVPRAADLQTRHQSAQVCQPS